LALADLRQHGVELCAATVDHRLRSESAAEARYVAEICRDLGISHIVKEWQGDKPGSGIAAAAREARYDLLCEAADEFRASVILTGHTADDQIETVTMRAARNSDPDAPGLAGMAEAVLLRRRHWLVRPFLHTYRLDIRAFLQGRGKGWIDDPSNMDLRSERVRTRQRVGAQMMSLTETDIAAARRTAVSDAAARLLQDHAEVHHAVLMRIAPDALRSEPVVIRYLLSVSAAVLGGREQGPAADSMQRALNKCLSGETGRMTAGRVAFDNRRTGLYLCREKRGLPSLRLAPGQTSIWDGRFEVSNIGSDTVVVEPAPVDKEAGVELFPTMPPAIAMLAAHAAPIQVLRREQFPELICRPILAPFDRFLPQFDYTLAVTLAGLFGCDDFPPLPFGHYLRKR
jgi:tRNA(Ile)-lysidine synthase